MYESHFGITAPPLQLDTDPSFFFSSQGHRAALAALRRGFDEGARFIVFSGEDGIGKTTLVRTALAELDPAWSVVAQVVGTQLDDLGLFRALQAAFGFQVDVRAGKPNALRVGEFVAALGRDCRRPVLVIDEAQNLRPEAFELLVSLHSLWPIGLAPLQVCLVGKPELRAMVDSPELRPLKALIQLSFQLGPLQPAETGAYLEQRLQAVGGTAAPRFEPGAIEEVFRWTRGVPGRINLLCDRLFLSRFLLSEQRIDAATVREIENDLRSEFGDPDPPSSTATAQTQAPVTVPHAVLAEQATARSLLCVVGGRADHVKAAALLHALAEMQDLPPALLVRVYTNHAFEYNKALFARARLASDAINLGIAADTYAERAADVMRAFEAVFDDCQPAAVIVFDGSEAALSCARVASRHGVPVAHIGAGQRQAADRGASDAASQQIDQLSAMLYPADAEAVGRLNDEGVPAKRIQFVGNLVADSLKLALSAHGNGRAIPDVFEAPVQDLLANRRGYGVVVVDAAANITQPHKLTELVSVVRTVSRDLPLLWPMHARLRAQLAASQLDVSLATEHVVCIPMQHYAAYVKLLNGATCVLTDSSTVQEEATALGVPCLTIGVVPGNPITSTIGSNLFIGNNQSLAVRAVWECMFNGGKRGQSPTLWDGDAARRITNHLAQWLYGRKPA